MSGPRKPRAQKAKTLVEMVLDLDLRMEGDETAEVLLPAEEWTALRVQADQEELSHGAQETAPVWPRQLRGEA